MRVCSQTITRAWSALLKGLCFIGICGQLKSKRIPFKDRFSTRRDNEWAMLGNLPVFAVVVSSVERRVIWLRSSAAFSLVTRCRSASVTLLLWPILRQDIRLLTPSYQPTDQVSSFSSYTRRFQDVKLASILIDEITSMDKRNGILVVINSDEMDDLPRADKQSERMIQTLEDIIRACVIDFGGSYHLSIRCASFEALYGRKCRSPVLWAEIGESSLTRLELVHETTDKVVLVKENPKAARCRQKSYVDYRHKPLEFKVGDRVSLKVTPWKGVVRFGKKGKLAPRYVGPFEIFERISLVAYRLRLPEELTSVHDTFHVSNLKKCLADANLHVLLDVIKVDKTLRFVEEPVKIMDREIKKLKRKKIALVKVRWNLKRGPKFTWEHEDQMRIKYPQLFVDRVVEPAS
ncbi:hypothetical protein Tco_0123472 [Tanacetum coccineum]